MLLIQNGANIFARDKRGERPADLAHIKGKRYFLKCFNVKFLMPISFVFFT